jgi:nicotinamide mononucleotide transporter
MSEILKTIWAGFAASAWLDQLNLALGILGVTLMIRRTLWAFPVGLVSVGVQGVLFFQAKFYADATLQVFFFAALAWGWWQWGRADGPELPVSRLTTRGLALTLAGAVLATAIWALALRRWTDAVMPWRDAGIAAFSVAAQLLQARKKLENWPFWIGVNLVAVASYWKAELAFTAFLYAVYLGLAVLGWRAWQRAERVQP